MSKEEMVKSALASGAMVYVVLTRSPMKGDWLLGPIFSARGKAEAWIEQNYTEEDRAGRTSIEAVVVDEEAK